MKIYYTYPAVIDFSHSLVLLNRETQQMRFPEIRVKWSNSGLSGEVSHVLDWEHPEILVKCYRMDYVDEGINGEDEIFGLFTFEEHGSTMMDVGDPTHLITICDRREAKKLLNLWEAFRKKGVIQDEMKEDTLLNTSVRRVTRLWRKMDHMGSVWKSGIIFVTPNEWKGITKNSHLLLVDEDKEGVEYSVIRNQWVMYKEGYIEKCNSPLPEVYDNNGYPIKSSSETAKDPLDSFDDGTETIEIEVD